MLYLIVCSSQDADSTYLDFKGGATGIHIGPLGALLTYTCAHAQHDERKQERRAHAGIMVFRCAEFVAFSQ